MTGENGTDQNKALIALENEKSAVVQLYGNTQEIAAFGYAVQKVAPWAKQMSNHDIGLVVRRALSLGLDPLNPHEVQIWVDKRGNVNFQLSYTLIAEWVRHFHGQHTEPQYEHLDEAGKDREYLPHKALAIRVSFIMNEDLAKLETLLKVFEPNVARDMVTVKGLGVALPNELESPYFAPAGRSVAWKVEKRALVDAYRRKFGTPTREQIEELRRVSGRDQIAPDDWVEASYSSDNTRAETAEIEADARESRDRVNGMTDEERRDLINQHRVTLHGLDWNEWDIPADGDDDNGQ